MTNTPLIIKACGLREADNIRDVAEAGADWLGLIFYDKSPRCVTRRPEYLPTDRILCGVFVSPTFTEVIRRVAEYSLNAVQLHGEAAPEMCRKLRERGLIVVRALPAEADLNDCAGPYAGSVNYVLFDTPTAAYGGSGRRFDLNLLNDYTAGIPFLLSGGIGPEAADDLAAFSHPMWRGIDVNSRFETAPGLKDAALLKTFITKIRQS